MNNEIMQIKEFLDSKGFSTRTSNLNTDVHFIGNKENPTGAQFYVNAYFNKPYKKDFIRLTVFDENSSYNCYEEQVAIETLDIFIKDYNTFVKYYQKKTKDAITCLNNLLAVLDAEGEKDETKETI